MITIIVLIILAGIAISMLTGDNGILYVATQAKTLHTIGEIEDIANIIYGNEVMRVYKGEITKEEAIANTIAELENRKYKTRAELEGQVGEIIGATISPNEIMLVPGQENAEAGVIVPQISTGSGSLVYYVQVENKWYQIKIGGVGITISRTETELDQDSEETTIEVILDNSSIADIEVDGYNINVVGKETSGEANITVIINGKTYANAGKIIIQTAKQKVEEEIASRVQEGIGLEGIVEELGTKYQIEEKEIAKEVDAVTITPNEISLEKGNKESQIIEITYTLKAGTGGKKYYINIDGSYYEMIENEGNVEIETEAVEIEYIKTTNEIQEVSLANSTAEKIAKITLSGSQATLGVDENSGTADVVVTIDSKDYTVGTITTKVWQETNIGYFTIVNNVVQGFSELGQAEYDAGRLNDLVFPSSITGIANEAFYNYVNLNSVYIGRNVQTIGDFAFENCTRLSNLICGAVRIGASAFEGCGPFETLTIRNSCLNVGDHAFDRCTINKLYLDAREFSDCAFYSCTFDEIEIGSNCQNIPNDAFAGGSYWYSRHGIKKVKINSKTIGNNAFEDQGNLTSVEIGTNVETIGISAFSGCGKLTTVTGIGSNIKNIAEGAFINSGIIELACNAETIGNEAFYQCSKLQSLEIGENVQTIGDSAFEKCTSLTTINEIGSNVQYIGESAFLDSPLSNLICGAVRIGSSAFENCGPFETVTIRNSCLNVGDHAFDRCTINKLYLDAREFSDCAFYSCTFDEIEIGSNCQNIPNDAFAGGSYWYSIHGIKKVKINAKTIGNYAFESQGNLTSVEIGTNVESIGNSAFSYTGVNKVIYNNKDFTKASELFEEINTLQKITLGSDIFENAPINDL